MIGRHDWRPLPLAQIADGLGSWLEIVNLHSASLHPEYREKNASAVESLRDNSPDLRNPSERGRELAIIGYALDTIARQLASKDFIEAQRLWHAGHELFRLLNPSPRPNTAMRQALGNAVRALIHHGMESVENGSSDASRLRDTALAVVQEAWGTVPPPTELSINEVLLEQLERVRMNHQGDQDFQSRFIRDNIETVLTLEIPPRLEGILDRWEEDGSHYAPTATRVSIKTLRRAVPFADVLGVEERAAVQAAVERGDVGGLVAVLRDCEDALEANLRLRLHAKADYLMPVSEMRSGGRTTDPEFAAARDLLRRRDSRAGRAFRDLHFHRSNNTIAKEWYAFVLAEFGERSDIFEIIELLTDCLESPYYRIDYGWVARWNLACALRRLSARTDEALDTLLPVIETDRHPSEVLELATAWALEQDRNDVLPALLRRSPYFEAQLLATMHSLSDSEEGEESDATWTEFRRVAAILRDEHAIFPDPQESDISPDKLDRICRLFIDLSMYDAGIEWFRERLYYEARAQYKLWECLGLLAEKAEDLGAAWRYRAQQWNVTFRNRKLSNQVKSRALKAVLSWAQRNKFQEDGLKLLRQSWRDLGMTTGEVTLWETRLHGTPDASERAPGRPTDRRDSDVRTTTVTPGYSNDREESNGSGPQNEIIQRLAGTWQKVIGPSELATRAADARQLIDAVYFKHPEIPSKVVAALGSVVDLASDFSSGVDQTRASELADGMKQAVASLPAATELPFELHGLLHACKLVVQKTVLQSRLTPDFTITPPEHLHCVIASSVGGEEYQSRIFARVVSRAPELAKNLTYSFHTNAQGIASEGEDPAVRTLASGHSEIIEIPLNVRGPLAEPVPYQLTIRCDIGGVASALRASGVLPVELLSTRVPSRVRYVTSAPVGITRTDLFHGRERELVDLAAAFEGGKLLKLYFVNGIRRVGKSSLMAHLGGRAVPDVLPAVLNFESILGGESLEPMKLVRQLIRALLESISNIEPAIAQQFKIPGREDFDLDPPWVVFDAFVRRLSQTAGRSILLCFDEMQQLVKRIVDPVSPVGDGFLAWLRDKIQNHSDVLIVCTGSEPYSIMRRRYPEHHLWGNMDPYDVSFVSRAAMGRIATEPVKPDGVTWLPEALDALWRMTEGHPWLIQLISERATDHLNDERRRVVGPGDIVRAAEGIIVSDSRASELWWNETDGLINEIHRKIAFLILQNQIEAGAGLPEEQLAELCNRASIRPLGKHLEEMRILEVVTEVRNGEEIRYRVRGGFLELYLTRQMQRMLREPVRVSSGTEPLAVLLDVENVKLGLMKALAALPLEERRNAEHRLRGKELASTLLKAASRHGLPRQKWAVADWERPFLNGDQKGFRSVGFYSEIADSTKPDASDHVLREKIHQVLREFPEISVFIIGTGDADFLQVVSTLREKGKHVILWSTRDAQSDAWARFLEGPDRVQIEWLEDLIFLESDNPVGSADET
jgi:hypothetical protein